MMETKGPGPLKILITGGAGRLGAIVCKTVLDKGFAVRIFDLENKKNYKALKNLNKNIEVVWGNITRPEDVQAAINGVDFVIHMAAILPPAAYEKPDLAFRVNVGGTTNIVEAIKKSGRRIPLIYTSSAAAFGPTPKATELLCPEKTDSHPVGPYGESKYEAEKEIKQAGIDYLILRLTATMYLSFEFSDFKRMFTVPLTNRVEYCHPYDTARAIVNAIINFDLLKGDTLIIAGGASQRMLYKEMVKKMLEVYGLPLPPDHKFTEEPYYLDWYDTSRSQRLLNYQQRTFEDFIKDLAEQINKKYSVLFIPLMRYFIGPAFGKLIVRSI